MAETNAPILLASLLALLIGIAAGKAWERYKLRGGRWIDRRKARQSPHYILGLNFLVSNQIELAIEELSRAAGVDSEALEVHMILGNLYREKGQVARAIQVHQNLLQRPRLTTVEHAYVLLCLGLDFRRSGFVDRALEAFTEVIRLDPGNRYALLNLEKLHEEQHQWEEAYAIRQQLAALSGEEGAGDRILGFLETEIGKKALGEGQHAEASRRFEAAIERSAEIVPAHLHLGDVRLAEGEPEAAAAAWERLIAVAPERSYLAFDKLAAVYRASGTPERFTALCHRLIAANPADWRARLALAKHRTAADAPGEALDLLLDALVHNPHGLSVHQAIWEVLARLHLEPSLVRRYVELTKESVFYLDPHVCVRCRYRSTELLWQCPQCHEWNTFVEERIAPADEPGDQAARDGDETAEAGEPNGTRRNT